MTEEGRGGPVARTGMVVAAILGGFALTVVLITVLATNGEKSAPEPMGNQGSYQSTTTTDQVTADDELLFQDCYDSVLEAGPGVDGEEISADLAREMSSESFEEGRETLVLYSMLGCLEAGETWIMVSGLPGVEGIYTSLNPNVAVSGLAGWSPGSLPNEQLPNLGVCYLNPKDTVFQTKLVQARARALPTQDPTDDGIPATGTSALPAQDPTDDGIPITDATEVITVDVGVTTMGDPFFAVVREVGALSQRAEIAISEVTHNYSEALPPDSGISDAVESVEFFPLDDDRAFTGLAIFKVKSYNTHDYFPWTDSSSLGAPVYSGTITVWCRGGTTLDPPTTTTTVLADGGAGTVTVGSETYLFTISSEDVCDPNRQGLFVVEAPGEDEAGRRVNLSIHAPAGAGFAVVEVGDPTGGADRWIADLNVYGEYSGQNVPPGVGANADIMGDRIAGTGTFYEAGSMEDAYSARAEYDGPIMDGTFDVDCSGA